MQIGLLDHVNVRTSRLQSMVEWYGRVLGMPTGPRPDFPFPGAWLYSAGRPTVHLIGLAKEPQVTDMKLEHFAFQATGLKSFLEKLKREKVAYELVHVPGAHVVQANVYDPDGNHIHIDFNETEAEGLSGEKIDVFRGLPGQKM
jgi:catechol 2,3-dioxygenase-like lactoylglutathione lyase family enzyme